MLLAAFRNSVVELSRSTSGLPDSTTHRFTWSLHDPLKMGPSPTIILVNDTILFFRVMETPGREAENGGAGGRKKGLVRLSFVLVVWVPSDPLEGMTGEATWAGDLKALVAVFFRGDGLSPRGWVGRYCNQTKTCARVVVLFLPLLGWSFRPSPIRIDRSLTEPANTEPTGTPNNCFVQRPTSQVLPKTVFVVVLFCYCCCF